MNPITDTLPLWSTAQTIKTSNRGSGAGNQSLLGIKKLRELILELAVQGKLVPQDPNDEPASVLLEKIEKEKKRLIKEGKIKKQKELPKIEKTYNLPNGWIWVRLSDSYDVRDGTHDSPKPKSSGYPLVTSKNLYTGKLDLSNVTYISAEDFLRINDRSKVDLGDILFAMIGSIGNPVIVDTEIEFSIKNVALFKYYSKEHSSSRFLQLFLTIASIEMKEFAQGGVQSFISLGKLREYLMPFPPLSEQHRIVAKVDELMALCDELERQQTDSNAAHEILVKTLLGTLTTAESPVAFAEAWQRVATHFATLLTTEQSIDQLKQTILQLAVMGKLVPQDPNDEPAEELLKKIAREKARLVKEGKIKKQTPLPEISEDEKPFELPEGWEWVRFSSIFNELKYGTSKMCDYKIVGDPVLRIPNVVNGYLDSSDLKFTVLNPYEKQGLSLEEDDLLIIRSNGSISIVGRSAIVDSAHAGFMYAGYLVRVRYNIQMALSTFLKLMLDSRLTRDQIELPIRTTSGVKNINSTEIGGLIFPFAPLSEQHRIVAKVDELFSLCDGLKAALREARELQNLLAGAVVEGAVR